jgi:hypothetical protein
MLPTFCGLATSRTLITSRNLELKRKDTYILWPSYVKDTHHNMRPWASKGRLPTFCGLATSRTLITTCNFELAKDGYTHSVAYLHQGHTLQITTLSLQRKDIYILWPSYIKDTHHITQPCSCKGRLPTFCGQATSRTLITSRNLELKRKDTYNLWPSYVKDTHHNTQPRACKGRLDTFCGLATSRTLITTHNLELAKEGYIHSVAYIHQRHTSHHATLSLQRKDTYIL